MRTRARLVRASAAATAALAAAGAWAAAQHPALYADLPDEARAAVLRLAGPGSSTTDILSAALSSQPPYSFMSHGVEVVTDRRWFQSSSVEGPGAPALEVRRWPGDTILAIYDLPVERAEGETLPPGVKLGGRRPQVAEWSCREATLAGKRADFGAFWCERSLETVRRLGALGVPGDAGFGPAAVGDLEASLRAVLETAVASATAKAAVPLLAPQLGDPPIAVDERKSGWGSILANGFTLGLPPGIRAIRLDAGVPPPRPMPFAAVWMRGRFTDRNGLAVAVGDETRAGYVARLPDPDETWRAGVAPPLGAPRAERLDEARLDDRVNEWTGAKRATVSHWKEAGYAGDWLVFRLLVSGAGIEIGLPVTAGWRSLALFWIPVTFRRDTVPPAPPPIDPAAALGVRFDNLRPAEAKKNVLIEGYLTVAGLRLEIPRGWWPVANLDSRDGLPVTFVGPDGNVIGRLEGREAGSPDLVPPTEDGWAPIAKPGMQRAAAIWVRGDGAAILVGRDGRGFLIIPEGDIPALREGWRLLRERADFLKAARR